MNALMRCAILLVLAGCNRPEVPVVEKPKPAPAPRPLTRLFVQDLESCSLRWADVLTNEKDELTLGQFAAVAGFPNLDAARQKLVQMRDSAGVVCVGVRDKEDGKFQSGWVLLHSGVAHEDHGDHGHWGYGKQPAVLDSRLDAAQGNPAHLYLYDGRFFLANDKLGGTTRLDPKEYAEGKGAPRFLAGGGGHITLAAVADKVVYAAWIDGGGPNKGRVDVTPVTRTGKSAPAYSLHLPSGGIHGASTNAGKVFFAPSDGICWVAADRDAKAQPDEVKVHHIPLGVDGDKPRRTGAFEQHGPYVLFVTGKGPGSELVLLDARQAEPKPLTVPLKVAQGTQAVTPTVAVAPDGKAYAFVFHDRVAGSDAADALEVIALDPNGDGDCSDARSVKVLPVGKSAVEGHFGHHDLAFDADRRFGFFTNPGDGTLSVLSLRTLTVVQTFPVGGKPATLVALGGRATED